MIVFKCCPNLYTICVGKSYITKRFENEEGEKYHARIKNDECIL